MDVGHWISTAAAVIAMAALILNTSTNRRVKAREVRIDESAAVAALRSELRDARAEIAQLRSELREAREQLEQTQHDRRALQDELTRDVVRRRRATND